MNVIIKPLYKLHNNIQFNYFREEGNGLFDLFISDDIGCLEEYRYYHPLTECCKQRYGISNEVIEIHKKAIKQDIKIFIYKILISVLYLSVITVGIILANVDWEAISKSEDLVLIFPIFTLMFLPLVIYLNWDSKKRG